MLFRANQAPSIRELMALHFIFIFIGQSTVSIDPVL